jgi:hypothetical protein
MHCIAQVRSFIAISEKPPTANPDIEEVWDWFSVHDIGRMLRGMALECLIKATWLAAGELLVENERFVGILGTKSHDLYGMYVIVCKKHKTLLNEEEKKLLARFSYAIISARYPISKSPRGNYPSAPNIPLQNAVEQVVSSRGFRAL